MTVGLSRSASSNGLEPAEIWRARFVAASVSSKRLEILSRQSSIVMRAMCISSRMVTLSCGAATMRSDECEDLRCEQRLQETRVARALLGRAEPGCPHDCHEIVDRYVKLLINNNIIEVGQVAYFLLRGVEATRDDGRGILPSPFQSLPQKLERRRQDENVHGRGNQASDLRCALPVDLEQNVAARLDLRLEPCRRRRIPV